MRMESGLPETEKYCPQTCPVGTKIDKTLLSFPQNKIIFDVTPTAAFNCR